MLRLLDSFSPIAKVRVPVQAPSQQAKKKTSFLLLIYPTLLSVECLSPRSTIVSKDPLLIHSIGRAKVMEELRRRK